MPSHDSDYAYDVFISYSHADEEWVQGWLLPGLEAADLKVCIDFRDFDIGVPSLVNMERGVDNSRHTLLVLTPAWVESEWAEFEELLTQTTDPAARRRRLLPLLLQRCRPPRRIAILTYADFTRSEEWEAQLQRVLAAVRGELRLKEVGPPLGQLLEPEESPFTVPFMRNPDFVGREGDLERLHSALMGDEPVGVRPAGLTGMGGIGKTQLVVEHAYRYRDAYPGGVFWINAVEPLTQGFAGLGKRLRPALADRSLDEQVSAAADYLQSHPDALLILDNLADPAELNRPVSAGLVPAALPCRVLFTTRRRDLGRFTPIEVTVLPEEPALQLLLRHSSRQAILDPNHPEHPEAQAICATLGYLPLALEIAGAHLGRRLEAPLAAYRQELLQRGALPVLDDPRGRLRPEDLPTRHDAAVEATLKSQWDDLRGDDARLLLRVAGQLPEAVLIPAARLGLLAGLSDREESFFGSPLTLALQELQDASLVEELREGQVRLHPLVHEFAARQTPESELPAFHQRCAANLASAYEEFAVLEDHCARRGVDAIEQDLIAGLALLTQTSEGSEDVLNLECRLQSLLHLLQRESHKLRGWDRARQPAFFAQQVYCQAIHAGLTSLVSSATARLEELGQPYLALHWSTRYESSGLVRTLVGHANAVNAVAVTPDGRRAISISDDETLKVWDLQNGKVERTFYVREGGNAVAVTGDGQYVISVSYNGTLEVWNLQTTKAERILDLEDEFTPDYRYQLSLSEDGILNVWNSGTGQQERTPASREERALIGHEDDADTVVVTRDGEYAICACRDGTIEVWDLQIWKAERTLDVDLDEVNDVAVTPDGRYAVCASEQGILKILNLQTGKEKHTLEGHGGSVNAVAVTPDGRRAISASADHTLKVWNLKTGWEERTLAGHEGGVCAVAVTPDGRHAISGSLDRSLKVWDLDTGKDERTLTDDKGSADAVAVTADGRYAISAAGNTLTVWNLQTGKVERTFDVGFAGTVAVTPDGRYAISTSRDEILKIWDLQAEPAAAERGPAGHADEVEGVAVLPGGGHAISASWDGTLKVWDLQTGQEKCTLVGHERAVRTVAVTPDGRFAVSGSGDGTLKVWDLQTGQEARTLTGHGGEVLALALAPDGSQAISASTDCTLKVWDLQTGKETCTLTGHKRPVEAVAVSPDGRHAISASYGDALMLWDLQTGHGEPIPSRDGSVVTAVAITPDGRYVIYGTEYSTLSVWDLQTRQGEEAVFEHEGCVRAVAVTPDGRRVVSVADDHALRVWDLRTRQELATVTLEHELESIAVAPDGVTILAGDAAGNVYCLRYHDR